jgi:polyhydroxyalkanoate synthesis regulator phasin
VERNTKLKIAAGVAAAFAVLGGGAAVAATQVWSPREESQAVIDDAAAQLGIEPSELSAALRQALENRIDQAVEDGRLTEEQGQELKERLESGDTPLLFGGFGFPGHGHFGHFGPFADLGTAASYLGSTEAELRSELADGKTLAEIAKAEGKSVDGLVQALVEEATARIDQAVADGKLTQARANELKEDLEERITDFVNGELRGPGPGFHHGFGPGYEHGSWGFRGEAPGFLGPRA